MSEPLSPDPRDLMEIYSRDKAGQAAQNAAANSASQKSYNEREARHNHASTAQRGSFSQPGGRK